MEYDVGNRREEYCWAGQKVAVNDGLVERNEVNKVSVRVGTVKIKVTGFSRVVPKRSGVQGSLMYLDKVYLQDTVESKMQ